MAGAYLGFLLFGLAGLTASDFRWKLAFFQHPLRTLATLTVSVAFFLIWDLTGIGLNIFFEGDSSLLVGLNLAPQLPVEEPIFLLLLCYTLLLCYLGWQRKRA